MKDVMLDIETIGVRPTSAIVQIGACYFDRETGQIGETFTVNIDPMDRHECGFTTDDSTIDWWKDQSKEAREAVFSNGVTYREALDKFADFLQRGEYMWSHATFDAPIVCNAFVTLGIKLPIHYRGMRDIRTLIDLADHHTGKVRGGIHHNALDDCRFQVGYVVEAINKLKNEKGSQ